MVALLLALSVMAGSTTAMAENFLAARQQALAAAARCQNSGPTPAMRHFSETKSKPTRSRTW